MKDTKNNDDECLNDLYDSMEFDGLLGWMPKTVKTTEAEISDGWGQYNLFGDHNCTKYSEGQIVRHCSGFRFVVREYIGLNRFGVHEYYLVPDNKDDCNVPLYATEDQISEILEVSTEVSSEKDLVCEHPKAYENVISASMRFWVCPDCKCEVDAPGSRNLSQEEIDKLIEEFGRPL